LILSLWNSSGTSDKKTGVESARPSFTACLALDPVKKQLALKMSIENTQKVINKIASSSRKQEKNITVAIHKTSSQDSIRSLLQI
jgi:hypothetical protein